MARKKKQPQQISQQPLEKQKLKYYTFGPFYGVKELSDFLIKLRPGYLQQIITRMELRPQATRHVEAMYVITMQPEIRE